ncbi:MAG: hypothetical protein R2771_05725 [Saprospiraceae bacterium]
MYIVIMLFKPFLIGISVVAEAVNFIYQEVEGVFSKLNYALFHRMAITNLVIYRKLMKTGVRNFDLPRFY